MNALSTIESAYTTFGVYKFSMMSNSLDSSNDLITEKEKLYKILVVDDHQIVREGIKHMIENSGENHIIVEAENGQEALDLAEDYNFDIILMDISMPIMDGIAATEKLLARNSKNKVLAISMQTNNSDINRMKEAGAIGYMLKDDVNLDLIDIIAQAINGTKFFPVI